MILHSIQKAAAIVFCSFLIAGSISAQERKVAVTSGELFKEIARMDSLMFEAFNRQDMPTFKAFFTEDLEWFQDNGGLLAYSKVFENFEKMFKQENKLTRSLVKASFEVHPVKDYGAIEIGAHIFRHYENAKLEEGTFKFLMIWQQKEGKWRISRVVSYDH